MTVVCGPVSVDVDSRVGRTTVKANPNELSPLDRFRSRNRSTVVANRDVKKFACHRHVSGMERELW